jgi:F0F1-type ATP synthase delta subunit
VLAQNDRLAELPAIADTFDDIMAAVRGEVKATVTTAEVSR